MPPSIVLTNAAGCGIGTLRATSNTPRTLYTHVKVLSLFICSCVLRSHATSAC